MSTYSRPYREKVGFLFLRDWGLWFCQSTLESMSVTENPLFIKQATSTVETIRGRHSLSQTSLQLELGTELGVCQAGPVSQPAARGLALLSNKF